MWKERTEGGITSFWEPDFEITCPGSSGDFVDSHSDMRPRRTQFRFYPLWNFGRFQNHTRSNGLLDLISKIWAIFVNFSEFFQFMSTNFGALFSNFWNSSPLGSDLELFPSNFRDFRIYASLPHTSRTFWVRKCCPLFVIFHVSTFWFWNNPLLELAIFRIYGYYQLTYRVH